MWSFRTLLVLAFVAALGACGFQPLYGSRTYGNAPAEFAKIRIVPIKDRIGQLIGFKRLPQVAYANRLLDILQRQQHELGLTPSARTRIQVDKDTRKLSPIMELIAGGGAG